MLVFDVYEFTQDTKKVFNAALKDEVIIKSNDGNSFKLLPLKEEKSPFENVPRVKLGITTQEIVEIIKESRAGV